MPCLADRKARTLPISLILYALCGSTYMHFLPLKRGLLKVNSTIFACLISSLIYSKWLAYRSKHKSIVTGAAIKEIVQVEHAQSFVEIRVGVRKLDGEIVEAKHECFGFFGLSVFCVVGRNEQKLLPQVVIVLRSQSL